MGINRKKERKMVYRRKADDMVNGLGGMIDVLVDLGVVMNMPVPPVKWIEEHYHVTKYKAQNLYNILMKIPQMPRLTTHETYESINELAMAAKKFIAFVNKFGIDPMNTLNRYDPYEDMKPADVPQPVIKSFEKTTAANQGTVEERPLDFTELSQEDIDAFIPVTDMQIKGPNGGFIATPNSSELLSGKDDPV